MYIVTSKITASFSVDISCCVLVSVGNTGAGVSSSPNLYLSRDGGVSWEETLSGSWRVSVADHGGLMVTMRDYHQDMSTELMYTCDEGYSWQTFTFIDVCVCHNSVGVPCVYV